MTFQTLTQIIQDLRSGALTSEEITQNYLTRITRHDPEVHAFLALAADQALSQARAADERLNAWRKTPDKELPPLTGVPIAIKDVLTVKGLPCTCGSRILEGFNPPYNATAVQRLLDAGSVVLGKTNTDEFAMGSSTENSAYGVTHNPWDLSRVPGGSSGGSAAAVAAGFAPAALGTDTGGSVRQPAGFCGVVGLKPTYGRVSRYGLVAFGSSLDCVGVLTHTAADAAQVYSVMAGYDPADATSAKKPVKQAEFSTNSSLEGLRIGVPEEYFAEGLSEEVRKAVQDGIDQLKQMGAQVISIRMPHTAEALPVYYLIAPAEASANLARFDGIRYGPRLAGKDLIDQYHETRGKLFGPEVKRRIMLGTYALSAGYYDQYYGRAQRVRSLITADFTTAFEQVDLIAAPATPTTAFKIGEHSENPLSMYLEDIYTLPASLAGIPAIGFPVGFDKKGLPIGMQLMAPHFYENRLLQTTHAYQQTTGWHKQAPPGL